MDEISKWPEAAGSHWCSICAPSRIPGSEENPAKGLPAKFRGKAPVLYLVLFF